MRNWNKETIEEQLKIHKKQNKDDRYNYMCSQFNALYYCWELEKYTLKLQKQLKEKEEMIIIMEKYFELISDLGFDYDGFNTVENLKGLIDELVRYARLGRVCNTTEPIYESNVKKHNILGKDILDKDK